MHAHTGHDDAARREAADAVASFERAGFPMHVVLPLRALGVLELSLGDAAAAHRILGPLTDVVTASGLAEPGGAPYVPDEIEALVGLGHLDAAGHRGEQNGRFAAHWGRATEGFCPNRCYPTRGSAEVVRRDGPLRAATDSGLTQVQDRNFYLHHRGPI